MKLLFTDQTDTASLKCCDVRQGGQKEQNNSNTVRHSDCWSAELVVQ